MGLSVAAAGAVLWPDIDMVMSGIVWSVFWGALSLGGAVGVEVGGEAGMVMPGIVCATTRPGSSATAAPAAINVNRVIENVLVSSAI